MFVEKFLWMSVGGVAVGFAFGTLGSVCLSYTENGTLETVITLAVAYLGYFVAENMVSAAGLAALLRGPLKDKGMDELGSMSTSI